MRVVGYALLAALGVLALLLLCAVVRTLCMKKKTSDYVPHPDPAREREYAEKLSRMVAYETVSHPDDPELEKFRGFHALLAELYPTVHEKLEKTEIDGNLLFFWEGKNHERPLVLMSHQDVVPEGDWEKWKLPVMGNGSVLRFHHVEVIIYMPAQRRMDFCRNLLTVFAGMNVR